MRVRRPRMKSGLGAVGNPGGYNTYVVVHSDPLFGLIEGAEGFGGAPRWVGEHIRADLLARWRRRDRADDLSLWLSDAVEGIHEGLVADSATRDEDSALGAIATVGCVDVSRSRIHVVHVGASRLYRFRAGGLVQLTTDHTVGAELKASGMSAQQVLEHPHAFVCTRCLGALGTAHEVQLLSAEFVSGDTLLFVSHELSACHDDELVGILKRFPNPEEAASEVVAAASTHPAVSFDRGATALVVSLS